MDRLTETRKGKYVIPLRNVVCGIDMPHWSIEEHRPIQSFLSGDAADKLAAYEDAEEQGLLVRLPCKVGDTVYVEWSEGREYSKSVVEKIRIDADGQLRFLIPSYLHSHSVSWRKLSDFGKTIFLTREEVVTALKGESSNV